MGRTKVKKTKTKTVKKAKTERKALYVRVSPTTFSHIKRLTKKGEFRSVARFIDAHFTTFVG
jgi:hypothetical protein